MADHVEALLDRIAVLGGLLRVQDGNLEYVGPTAGLTPGLRGAIKRYKSELVEHLRPRLIGALLAHLADHGIWLVLRNGQIEMRFHEDADAAGVDEEIVREIEDRHVEVAAWMRVPMSKLPDAEIDAFGYTREAIERFEAEGDQS